MAEDDRTLGKPRPAPRWAPFALGWSFLTAFPAPAVDATPNVLAAALASFPLVGATIGAGLGGVGLILDRVLPPAPVAVFVVALSVLVTGGLHLDGLMDTADGVFGGRSVERRLEIMRDSRVGAFGVGAGVATLLGQYSCLGELTSVARLTGLIAALTMARWAIVLSMVWFPSARQTGLGATFQQACSRRTAVGATALAALIGLANGTNGFLALVGTALVTAGIGSFLTRRLGGLTGDCYGAIAVVVETLVLYLAVAQVR